MRVKESLKPEFKKKIINNKLYDDASQWKFKYSHYFFRLSAPIKKKLQEEVSRYERFSSGILGQTMGMKVPKVDVRTYAKYLLKDGKTEEKRELLNCLRNKITLKDGKVTLQKEAEKITGHK